MENYNLSAYWDAVGKEIEKRSDIQIIAGDDEPYYRYKRKLFLKLMDSVPFENKTLLEVGCGPGGNLAYLQGRNCKKIAGVDISGVMVDIARKLLLAKNITVEKIDGVHLPYEDKSFDILLTSTVLQHITDEDILMRLSNSIKRVAGSKIILFERIERIKKGHETNTGRPVSYYQSLFEDERFKLKEVRFLPIQASYYVCGAIRKLFNKRERKEGEALSKVSIFLQRCIMPLTKLLDKIIPSKRDLAMLVFDTRT
jgi:SAM-dependent methyltransferase